MAAMITSQTHEQGGGNGGDDDDKQHSHSTNGNKYTPLTHDDALHTYTQTATHTHTHDSV